MEIYSNNTISYFGGIIVQQMVNADFAGVMFTKNPVRMDNNIVVETISQISAPSSTIIRAINYFPFYLKSFSYIYYILLQSLE